MNDMRKLMETVEPLFENNTAKKPLVEYFAREGESIRDMLYMNVFVDLQDGGDELMSSLTNDGLYKNESHIKEVAELLKHFHQTKVLPLEDLIELQAQQGRVLTAQEADDIERAMVDHGRYSNTAEYFRDAWRQYSDQLELAKRILSRR